MRKVGTVVASFTAIVMIASLVSAAKQPKVTDPITLKVVERVTTNKLIDLGERGPSNGDMITFHNDVYRFGHPNTSVGRNQGVCIRIDRQERSFECRWITFLKDGAITVEGPLYGDRDSSLAITGGLGLYRNARGKLRVVSPPGSAKNTYIFNIDP